MNTNRHILEQVLRGMKRLLPSLEQQTDQDEMQHLINLLTSELTEEPEEDHYRKMREEWTNLNT